MKRELEKHIQKDMKTKIVLLSGPRQVGKTTLSKHLSPSFGYYNFDSAPDRKMIKDREWDRDVPLVIFDELHKMKKWKSWIKGVFDTEGIPPGLLVTGFARMDVYRKGGDSLAGRYFSYRLHPLTVKEAAPIVKPKEAFERLVSVGGFPEPFLNGSEAFAKRWRRSHIDTVLREDLLDLEKVRDLKGIETLVEMLRERVASPVSYASLSEDLQVSSHTIKHWLQILEDLYIIFPVRPYHKNIARSLLKNTKYYFYDTGAIKGDEGVKAENAVACSLLAELHKHEDLTGSKVELHYLRDKERREIDFLTFVDQKPVHLIEVKRSEEAIEKNIFHFKQFFADVKSYQLVSIPIRKRMKDGVRVMQAWDFLNEVDFSAK